MAFDVRHKILSDDVVIIVIRDGCDNTEKQISFSECSFSDGLEDSMKRLWDILIGGCGIHKVLLVMNLLLLGSEDKYILIPDFLMDFDVGAIHGTNDHRTV